ncbi:hypothetical protein SAMD00019534_046330, partial [Acytostelium subglobosum LB1]|uniref:hypothetical protein n=1 Tax=Acytostelium subglobosum LB1 TaxID=1410327 RepID=UPI000644F91B
RKREMDETNNKYITLIGASNWDMFTYCDRIPAIGETIKGTNFKVSFGGKAANQAVQASLLGSKCYIITKLGDDVFGDNTLNNFRTRGVSVDHVTCVNGVSSGCASITVDKDGHNNIIIVGGSNDLLSEDDVANAAKTIQNSSYLLCQLETSLATTYRALVTAKGSQKCKSILNVSPVTSDKEMLRKLLTVVDILVVNEVELAMLSNSLESEVNVEKLETVHHASQRLLGIHTNIADIIVTLGAKGVVLTSRATIDNYKHIVAPIEVLHGLKVVDTTGAGDSFIGSLAHFLTQGHSLSDSIGKACRVAAISVTRYGTQTSYPSISEL